jgi:N-acetylglucosamine-6-phosphate deacetylase
LNPSYSGALPADCFAMPTPDAVQRILDAAGNDLGILTLAPELPGALDLVSDLARQGVVPAAGHTAASFKVMEKARDKGLAHVTHCFNAMGRFSHRKPGPIEAALLLEGLTVEVICDGCHVQAPAVEILLRCRGIDAVCLVSDATGLLAHGMRLEMAGRTLEVADGVVRDLETKALAGSAQSLLFDVTMMRRWFKTSWPDCARLAAANPAGIVGQGNRIGSLEIGKFADFFLLGAKGEVRATYVAGVKVWP